MCELTYDTKVTVGLSKYLFYNIYAYAKIMADTVHVYTCTYYDKNLFLEPKIIKSYGK